MHNLTGKVAVVGRRITHNAAAVFYTLGHARLGAYLNIVAYMYVSRESGLTANHATGTYLCRSGHTNLRGHDGVAAHFTVVGYLYEVVEFHATLYVRAAHCRP